MSDWDTMSDWDWNECGGFTSLVESMLGVSGRIIPGNYDSKTGQAFIPHNLFELEHELLDLCDALLAVNTGELGDV